MWPILHSYRAESASYICKVCEESIGYEKREDRNEVSMAIIMAYFPINQSLDGEIVLVHDDHKSEVYGILLISFKCITPLRGLNK